jgi:glycosyltransferase involved in cell wall biosynthesis
MNPNGQPGHTVLLLIDKLDSWSGTETHLHRLAQNVDPQRIRLVIATVQGFMLEAEFKATGVETHCLDVRSVLHPMGIPALFRLKKLIMSTGADLLVTYHTAADLLGPWAARMCGIPIISSRRDEGFTKKPVHVRIQRWLNRKIRGMIPVSHAVVRAVEQSEGYPARLQQVIWNGEDLEAFSPAPTGEYRQAIRSDLDIPDDMCVITSVGGLKELKDQMCQIEAMVQLKDRVKDTMLLVVGAGSDLMLLKAAATPIENQVRFLGQRTDVADILRASDIYIQTSRSEGFSNAILQAMATCLPVVVTAVGGNPEFVTPECGTLIEPGDPDALAAALEDLVGSPGKRATKGRAGRARCEKCGSLETMTMAYMDAFERAIGGDFPGPSSGDGNE